MPFLRDICWRESETRSQCKELENAYFVFPEKSDLWKDLFQECTRFFYAFSDERWNCTLWDTHFEMLTWKPQISALTLVKLGFSGEWLGSHTEISWYKIPFYIITIYPLAQRDKHTASICLLDSLNIIPGLQLYHVLSWGAVMASGIFKRNELEGSLKVNSKHGQLWSFLHRTLDLHRLLWVPAWEPPVKFLISSLLDVVRDYFRLTLLVCVLSEKE